MPASFPVTRRTMLRGVAVASVYVLSGGLGPLNQLSSRSATSSGAATFKTRDVVYATAKYFDSAWSQEVSAPFPVRFGITERAENFALDVTWDDRLFRVHGPTFAVEGEATRELTLKRVDSASLTLDVPADVTDIVLQVEPLNPYPNDNLADVAETVLRLQNDTGEVVDEFVAQASSSTCAPWSVEVTVDWVSYDKDIVPAKITMTSVGPNAAPGGLELIVTYADVLAEPVVTVPEGAEDAPATVALQSADGVAELIISTSTALSPDSNVELLFAAEASDSAPRPFQDFVPYLRLLPPADALGMRSSGKHSSYPVTGSGSQLSTYLPAPSAG